MLNRVGCTVFSQSCLICFWVLLTVRYLWLTSIWSHRIHKPVKACRNEKDALIVTQYYHGCLNITSEPLCFNWKVIVWVARGTDVLTLPSGQFMSRQSGETCFLRAGHGEWSLHSCNSVFSTDHFPSLSFHPVCLSLAKQGLKGFTSHWLILTLWLCARFYGSVRIHNAKTLLLDFIWVYLVGNV